ncbi:MAG: phosphonoacetaldehyde hydrolase [Rhizobiales bacterium]|nr:phosphonoacetaldehyde hydrolase [Hyphomicrobiales bacterium]OJX98705.1 MAG: phosphonoacetaldehyde hydrolase [Rhizobiales bacterium 63-22]
MGHLKAVVFDWAGTVVDFGSFAPMGVFVEAFRRFGIEVSVAEARGPMGLPKWDHVAAMLAVPRIAEAWTQKHGRAPTREDIQSVYDVFLPLNEEVVADYCDLVPGTLEMVTALRGRGLKIGSTTGYTRSIMERVLPVAAKQGYAPDNLVCAGDLPHGRPTPMNMYKCFLDLDAWPASAVVKVDDTGVGLDEGRAAGTWTVGVALSGNEAGVTPDQLAALSAAGRDTLRERASAALRPHKPHYIIDTVADLPAVIAQIEERMEKGERP